MFSWRNIVEFLQKAKHLIESSRFLQAGLVIILAGFILFLSSLNFSYVSEEGSSGATVAVIFDERAGHSCEITPFSQILTKGETAEVSISLAPSKEGNSYELVLGKLPEGITGAFDRPKGKAPREVNASFEASKDAQEGSFNAIIVYYEETEGGRLPNFCQFNLIIA